ncbi:divalent metal cation transporter, partial [Enterococcus faecalis]|uniref:divalent metal cation transporter n=1 Tax=Enterococcus faecalis TaxID=1351 RepID=UPI003D6A364F
DVIVVVLIVVIFVIFAYQVALSYPVWGDVIKGLVPSAEAFSTSHAENGQTPLTGALGIIGARVLSHNFYLYSSVVQR